MATRGRGEVYQPTYRDKRTGEIKTVATWWLDYTDAHGKRHRENSDTANRSAAVSKLNKLMADAQAGRPVGTQIERTSFADLRKGLLDEYRRNKRRSADRVEDALNHLEAFFGQDRAVKITVDRVRVYIVTRQERAANATINRELAALKRAFSLALADGKVASVPKIEMLPEDNAREGFLEPAQFEALHAALPEDLKDPIAFLWLSGWRVNEMRNLEWQDVYEDTIRLRREHSKNGRGRELPLTGELASIIRRAREARTADSMYVFKRDGKRVGLFRKSWATACKSVGLGGLLVHDLRRSAIRNFTRSGMTESVAMARSGHRTASVFRRYDITSYEDKVRAGEGLDQYLTKRSTESLKVLPLKKDVSKPRQSQNDREDLAQEKVAI